MTDGMAIPAATYEAVEIQTALFGEVNFVEWA